ncbi:amidophosphoribosyltransferase [Parabacteroides sp. An277]|uniref:ComF family protein n=1 Tax=Parabacteroides sp. An277 TaxID=1965619 RepID=UPI000B377FE8|nr:ComF family protein [Parabacteroides sp. An277]OUO55462.1 amidophosphoribosyltransferase [Parabacteroides sp. An277]
MKQLWNDIVNLFYPRLCILCSRPLIKGEEQICLHCLARLPYIRYESQQRVDSWFAGKSEIQYARAYLHYEKGSSVQRLIHDLKYHGNKELAYLLGRWAFLRLQAEQSPLCQAEILLPIPLHPKKKRQRGYNQAEWIAKGIASVLSIPIDTTSVVRQVKTDTQTRRHIYERWTNMEEVFTLISDEALKGKRVLLVDDVLTTGATFNSCASVVDGIAEIRLMAFALAQV